MQRRDFLKLGSAAATGTLFPGLVCAEAVTLAQIKAAGELRIGCEATFIPFTYREGGNIVGYDVDLAGLFCKPLSVKPNFIDTAWSGVIPSLVAKKFDIIMSSITITKERLERVNFTTPYADASQAILIRASDAGAIKQVTDLNGRILGVKLGSPGQILQEKIQASLQSAGGAGFKEVRVFDDHPSAYVALTQNRVDAVLNTVSTLAVLLRDTPGKYVIVKDSSLGGNSWAGIAVRKEDRELESYLNDQLARLKANGSIYELQMKWFDFRMPLPDTLPSFN
jgi:polar amino acid transport system substrate-binding protein